MCVWQRRWNLHFSPISLSLATIIDIKGVMLWQKATKLEKGTLNKKNMKRDKRITIFGEIENTSTNVDTFNSNHLMHTKKGRKNNGLKTMRQYENSIIMKMIACCLLCLLPWLTLTWPDYRDFLTLSLYFCPDSNGKNRITAFIAPSKTTWDKIICNAIMDWHWQRASEQARKKKQVASRRRHDLDFESVYVRQIERQPIFVYDVNEQTRWMCNVRPFVRSLIPPQQCKFNLK